MLMITLTGSNTRLNLQLPLSVGPCSYLGSWMIFGYLLKSIVTYLILNIWDKGSSMNYLFN
uniref:Uncharacterized protein n=1 Tax=Rhizophora mucronata TaxID=61149 RepID=A0A2P2PK22_RHIMU